MARPNTLKGTKLRLLLGDGATPEVFSKICALTAKGINFQSNNNEFFVPDCDNPDDPAWREMAKAGLFADITGSGIMDTAARARIWSAFLDENPINVRVQLDTTVGLGGGYWQGPFMFSAFNVQGDDGSLVNAEITLNSAGEVEWTDA